MWCIMKIILIISVIMSLFYFVNVSADNSAYDAIKLLESHNYYCDEIVSLNNFNDSMAMLVCYLDDKLYVYQILFNDSKVLLLEVLD